VQSLLLLNGAAVEPLLQRGFRLWRDLGVAEIKLA